LFQGGLVDELQLANSLVGSFGDGAIKSAPRPMVAH
jgi:hypothetical protein